MWFRCNSFQFMQRKIHSTPLGFGKRSDLSINVIFLVPNRSSSVSEKKDKKARPVPPASCHPPLPDSCSPPPLRPPLSAGVDKKARTGVLPHTVQIWRGLHQMGHVSKRTWSGTGRGRERPTSQ
jgi:hypothetical protein